MTIWLRMFAVVLVMLAGTARAELTIEITQGMDKAVRIAIVPFGGQERVPDRTDLATVISDDLQRSGQFVALDRNAMLGFPTRAEEVHFRDWKVLGIEYVVIGDMQLMADGRLELVWSLFDVVREERMRMETLRAPGSSARDLAHLVSDSVYERLTGIPGAFSTRIMYVLVENPGARNARYRLEIADADGARPRTLLSSPEPILSAVWSPDGRQVAYVSFEAGQPSIVLQELATGAREVLTRFDGLNSAPAWSPDGRRMALVLSRDGNPELYLMDLQTRALTRLTRHYGIDTEPSWTPDGRSLVFTSNRGGGPQIYRMDVATGETQRLTFEGDYNARGRVLPDGRHLIYVHRKDGLFHMALLELERDRQLLLTQANLDESPSVAPNGSMVIYATQQRGRGILAVVSIDGRVKYELPSTDGDVREPAWSPFLK